MAKLIYLSILKLLQLQSESFCLSNHSYYPSRKIITTSYGNISEDILMTRAS